MRCGEAAPVERKRPIDAIVVTHVFQARAGGIKGLPIEDLYVKGLQQIWSGGLGYVGKAAGQLKNQNDPRVFFIGGEYQVWIPGLIANDIRRISILPFLQPNTPFRKI